MHFVSRPVDLTWLEDFLALAECGSFSRAAERRHVAQPAFSRHIRSLEEWLGLALFKRDTHPATLTEAGRRFRPLAQDILYRLTVAREETRAVEAAAAVTVRFAATHVLSFTFFPTWLLRLESRVRLGPIHVASDSLQACEDLMLHRRAQFLLCHHHPEVPNRLEPASFESIRIGSDLLVPVAAPNDKGQPCFALPAQHGTHLPLLDYTAESGVGRIVHALRGATLDDAGAEAVFSAHLSAVLKTMALEGRGIAFLPESFMRDELRDRRLVEAGETKWHVPVEIRLFRSRLSEASAAESLWQAIKTNQ